MLSLLRVRPEFGGLVTILLRLGSWQRGVSQVLPLFTLSLCSLSLRLSRLAGLSVSYLSLGVMHEVLYQKLFMITRCFLLLAAVVWSRCRSLWQRVRRQPAAVSMRLHAFTELAKRQGCEICVYYSDHFPGTL